MNHCPDCDDNIPEWAERCVNCTEEHELTKRLEAERRNYEHFFMDPVNAEPLSEYASAQGMSRAAFNSILPWLDKNARKS